MQRHLNQNKADRYQPHVCYVTNTRVQKLGGSSQAREEEYQQLWEKMRKAPRTRDTQRSFLQGRPDLLLTYLVGPPDHAGNMKHHNLLLLPSPFSYSLNFTNSPSSCLKPH